MRAVQERFSTLPHIRALIAVALTVSMVGACGGGERAGSDSAAGGTARPAAEGMRVALLTPGPISDQSWNLSLIHI